MRPKVGATRRAARMCTMDRPNEWQYNSSMNSKQPSIVVLDGHTLNPGDLDWQRLKQLGDCAIYERSTPAQVVDRLSDADAVLTNKEPLSRELMAGKPRL